MNKRADIILVGDVGGTNTRLGLAHRNAKGQICITQIQKMPSDDYPNLEAVISEYFGNLPDKPVQAALALAGPIDSGSVTLTNRNWTISQTKLQQNFGFKKVKLYNDFAAMARSVPECREDDFTVLNSAMPDPQGPILVAGPGTGFGMATLVPIHKGWKVLSGEGGHQAYAPQTAMESEILHILQREHGFVSLELVSSGSGMDAVHKAVCIRLRLGYEKRTPKRIRELALEGDIVCKDVCEIRANAIMGALGDMALAIGARGGVVLAGGVAKRLIDFIDTPAAMQRFFNRGQQQNYVRNIQVKLLQKPAAALYGVAALGMDVTNG